MGKKTVKNEHILELLLQRPNEPVFMPKGENRVVFDVPTDYLAPEYQDCAPNLRDKYADEECIHVKINILSKHPKETFAFAQKLGRQDQLSDFIPEHQSLVAQVTMIFDDAKDFGDFVSLAVYARDNLNPSLFSRAFSTAVLHRPDARGVRLPSISGANPFKFFPGDVMSRVQEKASIMGSMMKPVQMQVETASNLDPEHRVAYFREDLGVNSHHWKWHLVYPNQGDINMVKKDRRGELFYYMHQQMIARYNAERLSNQLGKVRRFNDFREPIPEAYFPKLGDKVSMRNYPSRHANSVLRDINRKVESFSFDIAKLDIWRSRIYEAIDTGVVKEKGGELKKLTDKDGIDDIGNLLESSILSVNAEYYGNLHAFGHIACGVIHDPDYAHLERFSVMGDVATACRDPFFYRWHAMVDDLCQSYKNTLPAYEKQELQFDGVKIKSVEVVDKGKTAKGKNTLSTNWKKDYIDVANGLDFQAENKSVYIEVTHLQYKLFNYHIVANNEGQPQHGTVRIFIAPTFDEDGQPMSFNQQRTSFIEMDKFIHYFTTGSNEITRCSCESSITIQKDDTFKSFKDPPKSTDQLTREQEDSYFCGCGWPNHLLVPKGTCEGMKFDLFVMISDFKLDNVGQTSEAMKCGASSFCGIRDKLYPDKRAMGFPFDRNLVTGDGKIDNKKTLGEFSKAYDNIHSSEIIIRFTNTTVAEPGMEEEMKKKMECPAPSPIRGKSARGTCLSARVTTSGAVCGAPAHDYAGAGYPIDAHSPP